MGTRAAKAVQVVEAAEKGGRGASTRQAIFATAARLFAEKGYHAIGMAELGEAVKLSRGALYHHIGSKEEILHDICCRYMLELLRYRRELLEQESDPGRRLDMLGAHLLDVIARHRAELTVCFRESHSLTGERRAEVLGLHAAYENIWRMVLEDGERAGRFKPYSRYRLKGLLGMHYYSYLWMRPEVDDPAAVAAVFNDIVATGVRAG